MQQRPCYLQVTMQKKVAYIYELFNAIAFMKWLLAMIIGIFGPVGSSANCLTGIVLRAFPYGPTIRQNSIFVLNGMSEGQKIILGLNKEYNIYLRSGETTVRLLVTETHIGEHNETQALLRPETLLEPGREYVLCIDSLRECGGFTRYNPMTDSIESMTYKVLAGVDTEPPKVSSRPKVLEKIFIYAGCGPISHVWFSNPAKDELDVIVKTTVVALKTGKQATYYLEPYGHNKDFIRVGYDMCSGAFGFEEGEEYEVEFSFMDASGNMTVWEGDRIKFTKPDPEKDYGDYK